MRKTVHNDIGDIFNAPSRRQAEERLKFYVARYDRTAPKLSKWMEENLPEGLTVFALPDSHRKMMRTTNFRLTKNLQKRLINRYCNDDIVFYMLYHSALNIIYHPS